MELKKSNNSVGCGVCHFSGFCLPSVQVINNMLFCVILKGDFFHIYIEDTNEVVEFKLRTRYHPKSLFFLRF